MTESPQRRRLADPGSDREKRHEDKDMYTLHVGLRIRRLRQAQQMGVRTLANEIGLYGVDGSAISRWESGGGLPMLPLLCDIADALGTSVDYLAGRTDDPSFVRVRATDGLPSGAAASADALKRARSRSTTRQAQAAPQAPASKRSRGRKPDQAG